MKTCPLCGIELAVSKAKTRKAYSRTWVFYDSIRCPECQWHMNKKLFDAIVSDAKSIQKADADRLAGIVAQANVVFTKYNERWRFMNLQERLALLDEMLTAQNIARAALAARERGEG